MPEQKKKSILLPDLHEEELISGSFPEELFEEPFDLDDPAAEKAVLKGDSADNTVGRGADFRDCVFRKCSFQGVRWKNASFIRCEFQDCDFSNAKVQEGYFRRCRFTGCKLVGCDLSSARFRDVVFLSSILRFANLSFGQWNGVLMKDCDLSEASVMELQESKDYIFRGCILRRCELVGTSLKGIDLSDCEIGGMLVKGAGELTGATVTPEQAVQLSVLLGVILK